MLRIGLTGGIGSGKTVVAGIFEVLGIPVYYADKEARRLMQEDAELIIALKDLFGEEAYKSGELNRKYISSVVFNNTEKLEALNALVHPATMKDSESWIAKQNSEYVIHEAALIFEAGVNKRLDYVIGVSSPEYLRIKRVTERDNTNREEVMKRMKRQLDEETKMDHCDYILINDEQQLLIPQVLNLHEEFIKLSKG